MAFDPKQQLVDGTIAALMAAQRDNGAWPILDEAGVVRRAVLRTASTGVPGQPDVVIATMAANPVRVFLLEVKVVEIENLNEMLGV